MATFDHERAHMAANLVSDPPVQCTTGCVTVPRRASSNASHSDSASPSCEELTSSIKISYNYFSLLSLDTILG